MNETRDILFIHALTGLHPGSGTALGVVDLPVQRERHTRWPLIPGSTIKGVLRDACRENVRKDHDGSRKKANEENGLLTASFGPAKVDGDDAHAGAITFTDARILAYPVRSLRGVFAWVTCPAVLERASRDFKMAGMAAPAGWPVPEKDRAAFGKEMRIDTSVVLEEFGFAAIDDPQADNKRLAIATFCADATSDPATADRIKSHLVVLHDDDFTHFAEHATEVVARVGLDYERKTVKKGALFYEEFLPPETIFYSVVLAGGSRSQKSTSSAADLAQFVRTCTPNVLQIGGDETIGKGLCALKFKSSDRKEA